MTSLKKQNDGTHKSPDGRFVASPVKSQGCSARWSLKDTKTGRTIRGRTLEDMELAVATEESLDDAALRGLLFEEDGQ